jgi:S1-C subfamily serine protease
MSDRASARPTASFRFGAASILLTFAVAGAQEPATRPAEVRSPEAPSAFAAFEEASVAIAARIRPSVVGVRAYVRDAGTVAPEDDAGSGWGVTAFNDDFPGFRLSNGASGIVASKDGDVLSCLHPLQKADGSIVDLVVVETHDRIKIIAEVIGAEPTVNLALLRCRVFPTGRESELVPATFGDSDALRPGAPAFGVGDPVGPERTFAFGAFAARPSRDCYQELLSSFYIQASMIAPGGAYGGPLLDSSGTVVGMLSPRAPKPGSDGSAPRDGVEFAMPSKILKGLYGSLREARSFRSPWLGFSVMSREELAASLGAAAFEAARKPKNGILIENVFSPSPAAAAGLRKGDFLVSFDGAVVFTPVDFQRYLYLAGVGREVVLEVFREGETFKKTLAIEARPKEAVPK